MREKQILLIHGLLTPCLLHAPVIASFLMLTDRELHIDAGPEVEPVLLSRYQSMSKFLLRPRLTLKPAGQLQMQCSGEPKIDLQAMMKCRIM